jgi:hypothetical protein
MHKNTRTFLSSIIGLAILLCSCGINKQDHAPINREKMSALLLDIHFAEAYSSILPKDSNTQAASLSGKNLDSLALYHQAIFSKHKINIQDWEQALKWYTQHPQELDSVYASILPVLDSLKTINIPTTEDTLKRN